jgi:chromosome segregation ATPase
MTRSPDQRLDRIEDEFETVKQLLASAARYAESANAKIDLLSDRQDRTQAQLDQLSRKVDDLTTIQSQTESRLDEFIFQVQRLLTQNAERLIRVEGQADRLEALLLRLDRNYEAQQSQFLEFQRTTNAALERIDRVVDYLMRQQGNDNRD